MSRDIFSNNFKPYVQYTKGHFIYDYMKKKKVFIKPHYSYVDKTGVYQLDLKKKDDRDKFYKAKNNRRVFYK